MIIQFRIQTVICLLFCLLTIQQAPCKPFNCKLATTSNADKGFFSDRDDHINTATYYQAVQEDENIQQISTLCMKLGLAWMVLVALSLIPLILVYNNILSHHSVWLFIVFILGPIGLFILIYTSPGKGSTRLGKILIETAGDIIPSVVSLLLIAYVFVRWPAPSGSYAAQIIMIIALPTLVSWLVFNLIFLGSYKDRQGGFLKKRFVHCLITSNLGAGGISLLLIPLAGKSLKICSVSLISYWPVILWWGIAVAGAVAGGFFISFFNKSEIDNGCVAWSTITGDTKVLTQNKPLRSRYWILLSYLVLIAGVVAGAVIMK